MSKLRLRIALDAPPLPTAKEASAENVPSLSSEALAYDRSYLYTQYLDAVCRCISDSSFIAWRALASHPDLNTGASELNDLTGQLARTLLSNIARVTLQEITLLQYHQ